MRKVVDLEMLECMRTLRDEGLSNAEIAERVGLSDLTVRNYLGKNPPGVRRGYKRKQASPIPVIVEPEVKKPVMEPMVKKVAAMETYEGKYLSYQVDLQNNTMRIFSHDGTFITAAMSPEELEAMIAELLDVMCILK